MALTKIMLPHAQHLTNFQGQGGKNVSAGALGGPLYPILLVQNQCLDANRRFGGNTPSTHLQYPSMLHSNICARVNCLFVRICVYTYMLLSMIQRAALVDTEREREKKKCVLE